MRSDALTMAERGLSGITLLGSVALVAKLAGVGPAALVLAVLVAGHVGLGRGRRKSRCRMATELLGEREALAQRTEALEQTRKRVQTAKRHKGEFLAAMSREIRTPMNGIIGMAELLLETELVSDQLEYARTINGSARRLLALVNDVLDFSRLEMGALELEQREFDIRCCIQDVVERLFPRASDKGLDFTSFVDPAIPARLRGDDGRLGQVLRIAIGNAIKFTQQGAVRLRVTQEATEGEQLAIRFNILDSGCGISAQRLKTLFVPFAQGDPHGYGGSGLGLALSRRLVELMGGRIAVDSKLDEGTSVSFSVSCDRVTDVVFAEQGSERLAGIRALVVDDNEHLRRIVATYAWAQGLEVQVADSGAQALQLLRTAVQNERAIDLALLGLELPEMSGRELARHIKGDPALQGTKLVLLGVPGKPIHPGQLLRDGFEAWISKPIGATKLRAALLHATTELGERYREPTRALPAQSEPRTRFDLDVLVVEDNVVNQKVAGLILSRLGCRTSVASDGAAAVEAVRAKHYDLVFMDCQMPVMSGYEATKVIRSAGEHRLRSLPIVAMTANAMPGDRDLCLDAGMSDYLPKPVQKKDLQRMLEKWVAPASGATSPNPGKEYDMQNFSDVLDHQVIASLRELGGEDDPGLLRELVELFLDDTPLRIQELFDGLVAQDAAAIERAAHALKSSAANLGAVPLGELFCQIEALGRQSDLESVKPLIQRTREEFQRAEAALNAELS